MRRHRGPARMTLLGLVLTILAAGGLHAGEARNYASFFLQGRLSDPLERELLEGARVQLVGADGQRFETLTDPKGVFRFDKLPVQGYSLTLLSPDGDVIRSFEEVDMGDPNRKRLKIRLGRGEPKSARVAAGDDAMDVIVQDRPPRWNRFWKQLVVFAGIAGALAL